jgi:hypothetical protein
MVITENFVIATISDLISCEVYYGGITFDELIEEINNIFIFENDVIDPIKNYYEKRKELKNIIKNLKSKFVIFTEDEYMYINTNSDEYLKVNKIKEEIYNQKLIRRKKKGLLCMIKNYLLSYIWYN